MHKERMIEILTIILKMSLIAFAISTTFLIGYSSGFKIGISASQLFIDAQIRMIDSLSSGG